MTEQPPPPFMGGPEAPVPAPGYRPGQAPPGAVGPAVDSGNLTGPPRAPGAHELADYWQRAAAAVVDFVIKAVGAFLILLAAGSALGVGFLSSDFNFGVVAFIVGMIILVLCFALASLLYEPLYMAATDGKTIGKQLTGCRVVRVNGQRMDFAWSLLREVVVKWLAIGMVGNSITFGLPLASAADNLWPLWDDERRALHDLAVQTRVVKG